MNGYGLADKLGRNCAGPGPGLDDRPVVGAQGIYLFGKLEVNERPFFKRTAHTLSPLSFPAASYYKLIGALSPSCLISKSLLSPRGLWRSAMVLAASNAVPTAVSTAVRVVYGIHDYASYRRPNASFTVSSGLADLDILVLFVAYNAY